jgi:hypothetical protein
MAFEKKKMKILPPKKKSRIACAQSKLNKESGWII